MACTKNGKVDKCREREVKTCARCQKHKIKCTRKGSGPCEPCQARDLPCMKFTKRDNNSGSRERIATKDAAGIDDRRGLVQSTAETMTMPATLSCNSCGVTNIVQLKLALLVPDGASITTTPLASSSPSSIGIAPSNDALPESCEDQPMMMKKGFGLDALDEWDMAQWLPAWDPSSATTTNTDTNILLATASAGFVASPSSSSMSMGGDVLNECSSIGCGGGGLFATNANAYANGPTPPASSSTSPPMDDDAPAQVAQGNGNSNKNGEQTLDLDDALLDFDIDQFDEWLRKST